MSVDYTLEDGLSETLAAEFGLPIERILAWCAVLLGDFGDQQASLSLVLTRDETIRAINQEHRGKDSATDVLSFSQVEDPADAETAALPPAMLAAVGDGFPRYLGDIVVNMERARSQASQYGNDLIAETKRLLVHGFLHLLGHDHVHGGRQAAKMKREELRLAALLAEA